jgi:hypothetical protein
LPLLASSAEHDGKATAQLVAHVPECLELLFLGSPSAGGIRKAPVDAVRLAQEHRADLLGAQRDHGIDARGRDSVDAFPTGRRSGVSSGSGGGPQARALFSVAVIESYYYDLTAGDASPAGGATVADGGPKTDRDLLTFGIIVFMALAALLVVIVRMARKRPPPLP